MSEMQKPYRLKCGNEWAVNYTTLENAKKALRYLGTGTRWRIEFKRTRYGKPTLVEEGTK